MCLPRAPQLLLDAISTPSPTAPAHDADQETRDLAVRALQSYVSHCQIRLGCGEAAIMSLDQRFELARAWLAVYQVAASSRRGD